MIDAAEPRRGRVRSSSLVSLPQRAWQRLVASTFAPGEGSLALIGALLVVLAIVLFFEFATRVDSDTWLPVLTFVCFIVVSLPICRFVAGRPIDRRVHRLLLLLLIVKLLMAGPRYVINETYYDGSADAGRYYQAGYFFLENLDEGRWDIAPGELASFPRETRVVGYFVGMLFVVFGATYFGGFLIFSWFSWLGLVFFFRAFRIAFPNAPPYLLLKLMFLPSLLFWPSSLGKDALMVMVIGLVSLGAARVLANDKVGWGVVWIAIGGLAMMQVRPHLLLISAVALVLSTGAKATGTMDLRGVLLRVLMVAVAIPLLLVSIANLDTVFGGESQSLASSLNSTVERTEIGGSAFEARPVRGPQDAPVALLTVLYRPFIFEAQTTTVQIAAVEGMLLMVLTVMAARWIWRIWPVMYRTAFGAYCGAWVVAFVIAFSNIANAGILARQRVQMFPILLILVAAAYGAHKEEQVRRHDVEPDAGADKNVPDRVPALART